MSGIHASDVRAALERLPGPGRAASERCAETLAPDEIIATYEELLRRCPPERLGISRGAHAATLGPLFGEFE